MSFITALLKKYCTDRKRSYGGQPSSYGDPTKYVGVDKDRIVNSELIKSNRIEVIVQSDYFGEIQYLFILLKKQNIWLIDSTKSRFTQEHPWKIAYF